jgi:methylphosphotriester-DNA--protein-cysteine methyltransferase
VERTWTLIGADGRPYRSRTPGTLGGHRRSRIYGRLDCPGALRWIARGHYVRHRVFFADAATATAAGYRPCAVCLPEEHRRWRAAVASRNRAQPW